MIKLDLSKFKHVKSDKKSTTLKHADGHMLTLAHNALAPESQQQLAALSKVSKQYQTKTQADEAQNNKYVDGGTVDRTKDESGNVKPGYQGAAEGAKARDSGAQTEQMQTATSPSTMWQNVKNEFGSLTGKASGGTVKSGSPDMNMAKGGQVRQMYANQGNVKSQEEYADAIHAPDTYGSASPEMQQSNQDLQQPDESGDAPAAEPEQPAPQLPEGTVDPKSLQGVPVASRPPPKPDPAGPGGLFGIPNPNYKPGAVGADPRDRALDINSGVPQEAYANAPQVDKEVQDIQNTYDPSTAAPDVAPMAEQPGKTAPNGPPNPQTDPYGYDAYLKSAKAGIAEQQRGIVQQGAGEMQAAENKAKADIAYADTIDKQQKSFIKQFNENMGHMNETVKDMQKNHINPSHYMESRTSGQKVAIAIGLMLGGIGAALTHSGVNPMMDFIHKQIDRDIDSQKANQSNRATLLGAYQNQFKNNEQAELMTRATLLGKYGADIQAAANQAANPTIAGQMMQKSGELQVKSADLVRQATMLKGVMGSAVNPSGTTSHEEAAENAFKQQQLFRRLNGQEALAKDAEAKHFVGLGDANKEVDKDDRNKILGHQKLDAALADLQNWTKNHTTLVPGTPEYAQGQVKARNLQALIRESVLNTVYREGEQPILDQFVKTNPAGLTKWLTNAQLSEMRNINGRDFNILKHNYGLPASPQNQQAEGAQNTKDAAAKWLQDPKNRNSPYYEGVKKSLGR